MRNFHDFSHDTPRTAVRHNEPSRCAAPLPLLGSNQDSPDPESCYHSDSGRRPRTRGAQPCLDLPQTAPSRLRSAARFPDNSHDTKAGCAPHDRRSYRLTDDGAALIPVAIGRGGRDGWTWAVVDADDAPALCRAAWSLTRGGYAFARVNGCPVPMHRVVMPGVGELDHRDQDPLNNRRANLRPASKSQNGFNRAKWCGRSQFKGVSPFRGKWMATIHVGGKKRYLGTFANEADAARAYDAAARVEAGEFAVLNFPAIVNSERGSARFSCPPGGCLAVPVCLRRGACLRGGRD